ncbi:MAG: hypothetical protein AAB425_06230, partial [Bdellovibrionota bacterium]
QSGNRSVARCGKSAWLVDTTAPSSTTVSNRTVSKTGFSIQWIRSTDGDSGVSGYHTSITSGANHTGAVVSGWGARTESELACIRSGVAYPFYFASATDCEAIRYTRESGLNLKVGKKYYFNVRAVNAAGGTSAVASVVATVTVTASPTPSPSVSVSPSPSPSRSP